MLIIFVKFMIHNLIIYYALLYLSDITGQSSEALGQ